MTALMIKASGGEEDPLGPDRDTGVLVAPVEPKIKKPPLYRVVLLNDDYTPMEFVVEVLQSFFGLGREKATQVMLQIHTRGRGTGGVYSREVAESKVNQVNEFSRQNHHPLLSMMEPL